MKKLLIKILPSPIKRLIRAILAWLKNEISLDAKVRQAIQSQKIQLELLRKKEHIKIVFLVIHDSIWKYEQLYELLRQDKRFEVQIAVVPLVRDGDADMTVFNQSFNNMSARGYSVYSSFDANQNKWVDLKTTLSPDIVFFTNPHKLTYPEYYIDHFSDKLTCYVPYAYVVIETINLHYNQDFFYLLWRYFVETKYHLEYAKSYSKENKINAMVTGFPGLDVKYEAGFNPSNPWKPVQNKSTKKIIWAPHHTISGHGANLDYSSFHEYADFFLTLLETRNDIQIAFKPHPLLKEKLYLAEDWGKERTDAYFNKWDTLPNGQVEEGAYVDLFNYSDGMIMDSASFIVEYLYFDKPLLFTMRDSNVLNRFNSFGKMVLKNWYKAKDQSEVIDFIDSVLFKQQDVLKDERNQFFRDVVLPKNGKTASENIYNELKVQLC